MDKIQEEELLQKYIKLPGVIAYKIKIKYNLPIDIEELTSYGLFGLATAIKNFDLKKETQYKTYFWRCITGSIISELRKDYFDFRNINENEKNKILSCNFPISLEDIFSEYDIHSSYCFNIIEKRIDLKNMMKSLSYKEKQLIYMYYWEDKTQAEIGKIFGVGESYISQEINKIINKLKKINNIDINTEKENKGKRKKNIDEIKKIKELYKTGNYSMRKLAKEFSLSQSCIYSIIHGDTYKEVI